MIKKLHNRASALPKLLWLMMLALLPAQLLAYDFQYEYEGKSLYYTVIDEDAKTVSVDAPNGTSGKVIIPSEVTNGTDTYSVIAIEEKAFWQQKGITSVTIPNSVTTIGEYAFFYCQNMTSVSLGNSVTTIEQNAFEGCNGLTSVTIPNSVTSIGDKAFFYCQNLTSVSLGDSVTAIKWATFSSCPVLTSVTIPNSVTTIERAAFLDCPALTSVTIPNSVTSIGAAAFGGCSSLDSITIPNSVTTIDAEAFADCYVINSVTFQSPNEELVVGDNIFNNTSVNAIYFEGDFTIKSEMSRALEGARISIINFKGNYTIEESAFEGISMYYLFFEGTSYIGKKAFYNSNPVKIYLADCQGIDDYAFATTGYERSGFRLWCLNEEPPYVTNENAFSGLPKCGDSKDNIVFVPLKSIDKYKNAFGWTYFNVSGMGEINSLTFTPDEVHLDLRKSTTISYNLDATGDFEITESQWISSDEEVVVVNQSGMIQGNASGMAIIYFRFKDTYGLFIHTVKATLVTVGDVDFSLDAVAEKDAIAVGESTGVKLTYGGQGYTVESEQWATSDSVIAVVDENGVITGVAPGEATITLTTTFDNGLYATREISVKVTEESGIDDVPVNGNDAPAEFYNLNGVRVNGDALTPGLYIKRRAGHSAKVLVK